MLVRPTVGEDAAVIDLGGPELLVAKADPITFAALDPARYLLTVNGNDLATMGAEPRWLLVTTLLPEGVHEEDAQRTLARLSEVCAASGVSLVGGHTEITVGLPRTILAGCLLGTVARGKLLRTSGARAGDAVLLAGGIAIEGTAILASEHADRLRSAGADPGAIARAATWLDSPGISVLPAARYLRSLETIHAMHDPTEGGLATALHELAEAAAAGIRANLGSVPVLPESKAICDALGLDPLGLLASGALLAALSPAEAGAAVKGLYERGIPAEVIGQLVAPEDGDALPSFPRDELARFLSST
ncbi:MAG: hypothetical protein KIT09_04475 [Bryobacteraceae bacterium]|nr:hypothetical protein [Bryobacteraceae bacterium]